MKLKHGLLSAWCLLACGAAFAQGAPATAWTDPLNRFSVEFSVQGFSPSGAPSTAPTVLDVEHGALQRSANAARGCSVTEARVPRAVATTQGDANAQLYARNEQEIGASLRGRVSGMSRARVDGVSLLSFRLDTDTRQLYARMFYLAHESRIYQVTITCGGAPPLTMLDVTTMNQTLETLRFLPEASQ